MYRAKMDGDNGIFKGIKKVSENQLIGYKEVNNYFVDNSGFGSDNEPALTANRFLNEVKNGYYYGITAIGQFQVYIGEYVKINKKQAYSEKGILTSKKVANNTRMTEYLDGRRVLTLHNTDIITWQGNKIILKTGGWDTLTTRARLNQFLPDYIRVYRKKGITYINYNRDNDNQKTQNIELTDGIELSI